MNAFPTPILSVLFYANESGEKPVMTWLQSFGKVEKKTIGEDLKTVQFGWPLGMPLVRKLDPGLWEVRIGISTGVARVLFTIKGPHMVLLHAFVKKSQKTPRQDLDLARQRMRKLQNG